MIRKNLRNRIAIATTIALCAVTLQPREARSQVQLLRLRLVQRVSVALPLELFSSALWATWFGNPAILEKCSTTRSRMPKTMIFGDDTGLKKNGSVESLLLAETTNGRAENATSRTRNEA